MSRPRRRHGRSSRDNGVWLQPTPPARAPLHQGRDQGTGVDDRARPRGGSGAQGSLDAVAQRVRRRQPWLVGVPVALAGVLLLHPAGADPVDVVAQASVRWQLVHLLSLALVGPLGITVHVLLRGLPGPTAALSRAAIVPFVVFFAAFEAAMGIAGGVLVARADELVADDARAVDAMLQDLFRSPVIGALAAVAILAWLTSMLGATVVLGRLGAPRSVPALLVLAGLAFGLTHLPPLGPLGLLALAAAYARLAGCTPREDRP